jgi:hypothetical protein
MWNLTLLLGKKSEVVQSKVHAVCIDCTFEGDMKRECGGGESGEGTRQDPSGTERRLDINQL